ncbi:MAG: hypothetical protein CM15mP22_2950 [Gammaproteobacteria bacterium]|nr:MAG: hypothetical protein CM15mP22_2950 [Gammaproteobacteria bacterium]
MDLPVIKKTPGGQPSTDESVLQDLARDYELPKILLEHRTLEKFKKVLIRIHCQNKSLQRPAEFTLLIIRRLPLPEDYLLLIPIYKTFLLKLKKVE